MVESLQLFDLIDLAKGKKVKITEHPKKDSVPYLLIDTLRGKAPEFFTDEENYTEAVNSDMLMVFDGANAGLVGTGLNGAVGSTMARLRPKIELSTKYLAYFLTLQFSSLNQDVKGSAIPHIKPKKLMELHIRFPSLIEQESIVSKIEKQLTHLEASVKSMNSLRAKFDVYRKSVLKAAFEYESQLNEGHKFCTSKLGDLVKVGTGATPKRGEKKYYSGGTIPWVTSGAVNKGLIDTAEEYITERAIKETNCKLHPKGSLVVAMYGEGKTRGKISELGIAAATNQACAVLIFNKDTLVNKKYVKYFLKTKYESMRMRASGGVQPNLNLGIIKSMEIKYPVNKNKQTITVQEIESRFSVIDKVEKNITLSLQSAERLKKSILKSAFEGKLIENGD